MCWRSKKDSNCRYGNESEGDQASEMSEEFGVATSKVVPQRLTTPVIYPYTDDMRASVFYC